MRGAAAAITAAAVAAVLLTGCSDEPEDPCNGEPVVYVEADDSYRCGTTVGIVVAAVDIDVKVRKAAKDSPGKAVPAKPKAPAAKPKAGK